MVRREPCRLFAWITVSCANIVQSQMAQTLYDAKALTRCLRFFLAVVSGTMRLTTLDYHDNSGLGMSRLRSTATSGLALIFSRRCYTYLDSIFPVSMPHMKHASSLAIAVLATFGFLFWDKTIW